MNTNFLFISEVSVLWTIIVVLAISCFVLGLLFVMQVVSSYKEVKKLKKTISVSEKGFEILCKANQSKDEITERMGKKMIGLMNEINSYRQEINNYKFVQNVQDELNADLLKEHQKVSEKLAFYKAKANHERVNPLSFKKHKKSHENNN